jgi:cytochrome P450
VYQASTFDHLSPEIAGPAYWDAIRELRNRGPVSWVSSSGGYWAVTSYAAVLRTVRDWRSFTSSQGVSITRPSFEDLPPMVPIELDPPRQRIYRKQVHPHLTVEALAALEEPIRDIADELIDAFLDAGSCDIAADFARKLPGTVLFRLLFHSTDEDFHLVEPAARTVSFESDKEKSAAAAAALRCWAATTFEARRTGPERPDGVDVVDAVMHLNDDGEAFAEHELSSGLQLLVQGGVGTSASAIAATVRILCEQPDLQARVRADLGLVPELVEECLRLETPLPLMFRTATRDLELEGQQIKSGDKVGLFYGAANRDPEVFERPDEIVLERTRNPHLTFAAGPHRCVGSNLARLQIRIAIRRLLERLGPFRIPDGAEVTYFSLQARGPKSLQLEFQPA